MKIFLWGLFCLLAWLGRAAAAPPCKYFYPLDRPAPPALFDQYELRRGRERYSLYTIRPIDLRAYERMSNDELERKLRPYFNLHDRRFLRRADQPQRRRRLDSVLSRARFVTGVLLMHMLCFIENNYAERGVFDATTKPPLRNGLRKLMEGRTPIIAATAHYYPSRVFETWGLDYDWGKGLPTQIRLKPIGFKPPRYDLYEDQIPFRYLYLDKQGKIVEDWEVSNLLSQRRWIIGRPGEFTKLAKAPDSPRDFAPEILSLYSVEQRFWDPTPIPRGYPRPDISETLYRKLVELKRRRPWIPDEILFPRAQAFPILSDIYATTFGGARHRLFERDFAYPRPEWDYADPHQDVRTFISRLPSWDVSIHTQNALAARPDYRLVREGTLARSLGPLPFEAANYCGFIVGFSRLPSDDEERYYRDIGVFDQGPAFPMSRAELAPDWDFSQRDPDLY